VRAAFKVLGLNAAAKVRARFHGDRANRTGLPFFDGALLSAPASAGNTTVVIRY